MIDLKFMVITQIQIVASSMDVILSVLGIGAAKLVTGRMKNG
jgi:hypothetical protein